MDRSNGGPQLLKCFPCTSNQQLVNRTCIDVEAPTEDAPTEDAPTEDAPTEDAPTEETQTDAPTGDGADTPL